MPFNLIEQIPVVQQLETLQRFRGPLSVLRTEVLKRNLATNEKKQKRWNVIEKVEEHTEQNHSTEFLKFERVLPSCLFNFCRVLCSEVRLPL